MRSNMSGEQRRQQQQQQRHRYGHGHGHIVSFNNNGGNNYNGGGAKKQKEGNQKNHMIWKDRGGLLVMGGGDLWTDGLVCAFEYIRVPRKPPIPPPPASASLSLSASNAKQQQEVLLHSASTAAAAAAASADLTTSDYNEKERENEKEKESFPRSHWVPIGWPRLSQLVQMLPVVDPTSTSSQPLLHFPGFDQDDDQVTVADMVAPYWDCPGGLIWWCHVDAAHPHVISWLTNAQWLHPAISIALRDESRLISERMKFLLYEVPVVVAGGLLFELLGQSAGDPYVDEDDIPIVLRSWHSQNFLITALHLKGSSSNINVLGIAEVQELLAAGGTNVPRSIHEVIAHLTCRLARWDDRLFRKSIFGVADEVELKFMNRRMHEDVHLFSVILNQEIRRLSTQVIRVKWSLHAREEIVFELLQHLRGNAARSLLEGIRKSTREMIEEQEAVRGRLFTIQDVMQSTVRAWLQDRSLRVTHNLGVFGGCGLVLSIITGLFGINVDGMPGAQGSPYAFALFSGVLCLLGVVLIAIGLLYLGLKKPIDEEDVEVRKLELQELVRMFKHEAESHAQVRKTGSRIPDPLTTRGLFIDEEGYILIG